LKVLIQTNHPVRYYAFWMSLSSHPMSDLSLGISD
jgi:hypothetical protein